LNAQHASLNDNNSEIANLNTIFDKGVPNISSNDVVVLCVELSGRALISGQNGIFTPFLQEIQKKTNNLVLFVDRLDRVQSPYSSIYDKKEPQEQNNDFLSSSSFSDSIDDSALKNQVKKAKKGKRQQTMQRIVFGDNVDLMLDEELQNSQNILAYFKHRCYHWGKRDENYVLCDFWHYVLMDVSNSKPKL
jgi:isochorismate synthase EntC